VQLSKFDDTYIIGSIFFAKEETNSLDWATLGALYSRSTGSVEDAVRNVVEKRSRVIEQYFVGYGHKSIGDMVDVKMFIEGVPIFIAFLLEHHSLFRGQESSTRYIDFTNQPAPSCVDRTWYNNRIDDYSKSLAIVTSNLLYYVDNNKALTDQERKIHERAAKARAFDVCRCLLPNAASTNVAWFGTINSISNHLKWLSQEYPRYEPWFADIRNALAHEYPEIKNLEPVANDPWTYDLIPSTGRYMAGLLDFGSLRDLNRHRVGRHKKLSETVESYMHPWYIKQLEIHNALPIGLFDTLEAASLENALLGQMVRYAYRAPIAQMEYVVRLRSRTTVHPTLRLEIQDQFKNNPWVDITPDAQGYGYFVSRGKQTIEQKVE